MRSYPESMQFKVLQNCDELTHFAAEVTYKINLTGFIDLSVEDLVKAKSNTVI